MHLISTVIKILWRETNYGGARRKKCHEKEKNILGKKLGKILSKCVFLHQKNSANSFSSPLISRPIHSTVFLHHIHRMNIVGHIVWGLNDTMRCLYAQPPTMACKMEAQLEHVHVAYTFLHRWHRFACSVAAQQQKFLHRSSVGSLLRVRCWLGRITWRSGPVLPLHLCCLHHASPCAFHAVLCAARWSGNGIMGEKYARNNLPLSSLI